MPVNPAGCYTPFREVTRHAIHSARKEVQNASVPLGIRTQMRKMLEEPIMPCCETGTALKEEYDNALRFEALTYARLIAHKRRHETVQEIPNVHHMRMVNKIAQRYEEGAFDTHREVPPA